jgi:hypothetical protein
MFDSRSITWTESSELQSLLKETSEKVTKSLEEEAKLEGRNPGQVWKWDSNGNSGDLHDDVVLGLQTELRLPELIRTYRRARMQYYTHKGRD